MVEDWTTITGTSSVGKSYSIVVDRNSAVRYAAAMARHASLCNSSKYATHWADVARHIIKVGHMSGKERSDLRDFLLDLMWRHCAS